jgi:hypothetical protein
MNKRFAAGFLATASTAAVLALPAASASAAPSPCGVYPAGQAYALQIVPRSARIKKDTIVSARGTLRRGGEPCVGFPLGVYAKPFDRSDYRLIGSDTTDSTGSIHGGILVDRTLRFYFNCKLSPAASVRSRITEFVAV